MSQDGAPATRCGFIAIIGATNAGKSTLLNGLVGSKVAIVTHKAQTTRARLRAIAIHRTSQLIFVDTPGIFEPKRKLDEAMVEAAWSGAGDADAIILLVDAKRGRDTAVEHIMEELQGAVCPVVLSLNKIDLIERSKLLQLSATLNDQFHFEQTFMISALTGDGLDALKDFLAGAVPSGPWLYPEDQIADVPVRQMAAEVTREKLYLRLHDELPYASTVETERWKELKDGSVRIEQVVFVERPSQKKIVLGENGRTIKAIGSEARGELQRLLDRKVHLFLFAKARANWSHDPERFEMMGLEYPKKR